MKKNNFKQVLIWGSVALVLIVVVTLFSKQGWKKYVSQNIFSINYPSGWFVEAIGTNPVPYPDGREYLVTISDQEAHPKTSQPSFSYPGSSIIFIVRFPKKGADFVETLAAGNFNKLEKSGARPQKTTIQIDNRKTILLKYQNTGFGTLDREYWIDGEKFVYNISSSIFSKKVGLRAIYYDLLTQKIIRGFHAF